MIRLNFSPMIRVSLLRGWQSRGPMYTTERRAWLRGIATAFIFAQAWSLEAWAGEEHYASAPWTEPRIAFLFADTGLETVLRCGDMVRSMRRISAICVRGDTLWRYEDLRDWYVPPDGETETVFDPCGWHHGARQWCADTGTASEAHHRPSPEENVCKRWFSPFGGIERSRLKTASLATRELSVPRVPYWYPIDAAEPEDWFYDADGNVIA